MNVVARETRHAKSAAAIIRLRLAVQAARLGVWDWDLLENTFEYSPRAREIFGLSPDEEITLDGLRALTYPADRPLTSAQARRALDPHDRVNIPFEYRIIRHGELRWVRAHGEAIFADLDGGRRPVRFVGTIEDITERRAADEAASESARKLRLAVEIARMAIWEVDVATGELTVTPELNAIFGFPPNAVPTIEHLRACYCDGEQERIRLAGEQAMAAGHTKFEVDFRIRRLDGVVRWLLLRAEVLRDIDGNYSRVIGVLLDIDEQKRNLERQQLLAREPSHRVKNSLTVVQALAGQTFRENYPIRKSLEEFRGRLQSLAFANDILVTTEWQAFGLRELLLQVTLPYRNEEQSPFEIECEEHFLHSRLSQPMALALHELCTNAAKYGSLSVPEGRVSIRCREVSGRIELAWKELGGPQISAKPSGGFGTRLLTSILVQELGALELRFDPDGLYCLISIDPPAPPKSFAMRES
jgi:PAS domain S-box-containing protein